MSVYILRCTIWGFSWGRSALYISRWTQPGQGSCFHLSWGGGDMSILMKPSIWYHETAWIYTTMSDRIQKHVVMWARWNYTTYDVVSTMTSLTTAEGLRPNQCYLCLSLLHHLVKSSFLWPLNTDILDLLVCYISCQRYSVASEHAVILITSKWRARPLQPNWNVGKIIWKITQQSHKHI